MNEIAEKSLAPDGEPGVGPKRGRLNGKVALVFGAGSAGRGWGNGKATAYLYAHEGAKVVAVDIFKERAEETANLIRTNGGECIPLVADVTDENDVKATIEKVKRDHGRIDVLHNNVGVARMTPFVDITLDSWREVIDTNLTGVFLTCKHAIPVMVAQGGGSIVNISSAASLKISKLPYASYNAAKAGLNQLTRAIAVRYARDGIRANIVSPGLINTPLIYTQVVGEYESPEAMIASRNKSSPTGEMGEAWDIAYASLFFASDESKYVNGVCMPVDGGRDCASV